MNKVLIALALYLRFTSPSFAAGTGPSNTAGWNCPMPGRVPTIKCIEPLFQHAAQAILGISALTLFVMLLVAGYKFMLSGGDQKKLQESKGTMTNAIIGMVVIAVSYLILLTIKEFTGAPVTTFTIGP